MKKYTYTLWRVKGRKTRKGLTRGQNMYFLYAIDLKSGRQIVIKEKRWAFDFSSGKIDDKCRHISKQADKL